MLNMQFTHSVHSSSVFMLQKPVLCHLTESILTKDVTEDNTLNQYLRSEL